MRRLLITPETRDSACREAAEILLRGGVIIMPTDTVYGIAAHPDHPDAVARIVALKGRDGKKPIALLAPHLEAIADAGGMLTNPARRLGNAFWPGALTLVLPTPTGNEGVRIPDSDCALLLLRQVGSALRVTSANVSGKPPALQVDDIDATVQLGVDLILDDGPVPGGTASTVCRVDSDGLTILRPGPITATQLAQSADLPIKDLHDA